MSTITTRAAVDTEQRIPLRDVGYHVYDTLIEALSTHSPVRLAYDGKDLEIMTKGRSHEGFRRWIDRIIVCAAGVAGRRLSGLGEATWKRPDLERGIEADQCYFFTDEKIDQVAALLRRRSENPADYPAPDLVVEIDISPPLADREGIYAAMRVPELWIFDGETLSIKQLGPDGVYVDADQSLWLTIRPDEVVRWLLDEDTSEEYAWEERLRAWLANSLGGQAEGGGK